MAAKKASKPTMAQAFKSAQKSAPTKVSPPSKGGAGGGTKPPKGPAGKAEDAIEQAIKDAAGVVAGVIKNAGKGADMVGDKVASIIDGALKVINTPSSGKSMLKLEPEKGKGKGKGKSMLEPLPKAPKRGGERKQPPSPGEYGPRRTPKTTPSTLPETK